MAKKIDMEDGEMASIRTRAIPLRELADRMGMDASNLYKKAKRENALLPTHYPTVTEGGIIRVCWVRIAWADALAESRYAAKACQKARRTL